MTLGELRIRLMVIFIPLFGDFSIFVGFLCRLQAIEYSLCKSVSEYSAQCTVFFGLQERCKKYIFYISSISYISISSFIFASLRSHYCQHPEKRTDLSRLGEVKVVFVMPESKYSFLAGNFFLCLKHKQVPIQFKATILDFCILAVAQIFRDVFIFNQFSQICVFLQ